MVSSAPVETGVRMRAGGFTLVEMLVALWLFTAGVLFLASGSALAVRMIGRSRAVAGVARVAAERIETIRHLAISGQPGCAALASGSLAYSNGITENWQVTGSGPSRTITVVVGSLRPQGPLLDTVVTVVRCRLP